LASGRRAALLESLEDALDRLLRGTGLSPDDVAAVDFDPYGPRIIITLEPWWAKRVVLDVSPDGVEATLLLEAPRGLEQRHAEEAIFEAVEEAPGAEALDEYDVAYDPSHAEAMLELHVERLTHMPNLGDLAARVKKRLEAMAPRG